MIEANVFSYDPDLQMQKAIAGVGQPGITAEAPDFWYNPPVELVKTVPLLSAPGAEKY